MSTGYLTAFESDPWGTILPTDKARDEWHRVGGVICQTLNATLLGYGSGWLVQAEGYSGAWTMPTGLGLRIYALALDLAHEEALHEETRRAWDDADHAARVLRASGRRR